MTLVVALDVVVFVLLMIVLRFFCCRCCVVVADVPLLMLSCRLCDLPYALRYCCWASLLPWIVLFLGSKFALGSVSDLWWTLTPTSASPAGGV